MSFSDNPLSARSRCRKCATTADVAEPHCLTLRRLPGAPIPNDICGQAETSCQAARAGLCRQRQRATQTKIVEQIPEQLTRVLLRQTPRRLQRRLRQRNSVRKIDAPPDQSDAAQRQPPLVGQRLAENRLSNTLRRLPSAVSAALNSPAWSHWMSNRDLRSSMDRPSAAIAPARSARSKRLRSRSLR